MLRILIHSLFRLLLFIALTSTVEAVPDQAYPLKTLPAPVAPGKVELDGYVQSEGAKIYYAMYGTGEPLFLLHGGLGNGEHWGGQIRKLSKRYRVIAIDSRGHGRSTQGNRQFSYGLMARDVLAVMDKLSIRKAAIAGWSDGGIIALAISIHYPERVGKIAVLGTNYNLSGMKKPPKGSTTFSEYRTICAKDHKRLSNQPGSFDILAKRLSLMWRREPTFTDEQLKKIGIPVAVITGEHDEIIRRDHSERMSELIRNAKHYIIHGTSHFALWQAPEKVADIILEYMDGK